MTEIHKSRSASKISDKKREEHRHKSGVISIAPNESQIALDPQGKNIRESKPRSAKHADKGSAVKKDRPERRISEKTQELDAVLSSGEDMKAALALTPNPEFVSEKNIDKNVKETLQNEEGEENIKRRGPSGGYYFECFLKEVLTNIRHNPMMSVASVSTVMVLALILGLFVLIIANLESLADELAGEMHIKAYMSSQFDPETVSEFKDQVYNIGHVSKVNFIPKDEAFQKLREKLSSNLNLSDLEENPLPDAFEIPVDDPSFLEAAAQKIAQLPNVESVDYGREEAQKLIKLNRVVRVVGIIILALLFASSLLIISNTIRLTVYARRKEIDIMQLVGAANWFIRWPFILEGIIQGAIGSSMASLLIDVSYKIVVPQVQRSISFLPILLPNEIMPYLNIGLITLGCAVGAMGSLISVNRYLKA